MSEWEAYSKKQEETKTFDYNIVLIGFMGTGKSTISECLSKMFAMEVIEMDQVIVEREAMSIPDIFATYGEAYFRRKETDLLREMQSRTNTIISCGGGAALREENVVEMKKNGKVVLLTASPEVIFERIGGDENRPVLKNRQSVEGIAELMQQRRAKYEAAADLVINTDCKTIPDICGELVQKLTELTDDTRTH